jgi:hypothetical protein
MIFESGTAMGNRGNTSLLFLELPVWFEEEDGK